jgi:hypothetical protein
MPSPVPAQFVQEQYIYMQSQGASQEIGVKVALAPARQQIIFLAWLSRSIQRNISALSARS